MSNKYVTFDNFKPENLGGSEPEPGQAKVNGETINYNNIKLHYNYGTAEDPIISDFLLELPECTTTGIRYKDETKQGPEGPYTKRTASMMIRFDLDNPKLKSDLQKALESLDGVHRGTSEILGRFKGKVKLFSFDPKNPGETFKSPVYWPRDPNSGEKILGKNPNLWVNLKTMKTNKTLFTGLDGKPVDWKLLENVDITFVPLLHFEKIFVGKVVSMKAQLVSAVLLRVSESNTQTRQQDTLQKLKDKYGAGMQDEIEQQLAQLRMKRQDELAASSGSVSSTSSSREASHDMSNGSIHSIPTDASSLNDFLGGAPSMSTPPSVPHAASIPLSVPHSLPTTASVPNPQIHGFQTQTQTPASQVSGPPVFNVGVPTGGPRMNIQTTRIS